MQPYYEMEKNDVIVAPINVAGMGVFAARDFREGEVVCLYTGTCYKSVEGNDSHYLLESRWWNGKSWEKWFLDGSDRDNASGRYINDSRFSEYHNNVGYATSIQGEQHEIVRKWFVNVKAIEDIPKGTELFADYGDAYWENFASYGKFTDPKILTDAQYKERMRC